MGLPALSLPGSTAGPRQPGVGGCRGLRDVCPGDGGCCRPGARGAACSRPSRRPAVQRPRLLTPCRPWSQRRLQSERARRPPITAQLSCLPRRGQEAEAAAGGDGERSFQPASLLSCCWGHSSRHRGSRQVCLSAFPVPAGDEVAQRQRASSCSASLVLLPPSSFHLVLPAAGRSGFNRGG